jgi:hypothetical protein
VKPGDLATMNNIIGYTYLRSIEDDLIEGVIHKNEGIMMLVLENKKRDFRGCKVLMSTGKVCYVSADHLEKVC